MNTRDSIRAAYDHAAQEYARRLSNELEGKPIDRKMLQWFHEQAPKGETILEIGSGSGEVSAFLASLGARCLATDIAPEMVE